MRHAAAHARSRPASGARLAQGAKLAVALVVPIVLGLVGGAAWAYWLASSTPGSGGAGAATTVNAGAAPSGTVAGPSVTLSWAASTLATGRAVSGYQVKRYNATTLALQAITSGCTGAVATTGCVETTVPAGSWKYSITPLFSTNWRGAESAMSSTVVVADQPPVAVPDSYSTNQDATLTVAAPGVLGNDTDTDGDALTSVLVTGPANGAVTLSATGAFVYVPGAGFRGSDSFTYKANDGALDSAPATVTITVAAVNNPPVNAVPGSQETPKNTNKVFSTATNNAISISDPDAGAASVQVALTATNGTLTLPAVTGLTFSVGDGTADATMTFTGPIATINARLNGLAYIPTTNFTGAGSVQIVTNDLGNTGSGGAKTDTDTVSVTMHSLGIFDAAGDIGTLADPLTTGSSAYSAGSYTVKGGGSDIWNNADHFQYLERQLTGDGRLTARVVSQSQGLFTGAAKAGVMLRQTLAAGSAHAMSDVTQSNGSEFVWRTTTNGSSASATSTGVAAPYWVRITRVGDTVTSERSADGVTWTQMGTSQTIVMGSTVYIGLAVSAVNNLTVNTAVFDNVSISTPPTAVADAYSANENATLTVPASGVLTNDTDPENNTLSAVLVASTTGLTLNANGSFSYTPPADFTGTASFTYRASDGAFTSNTVTVTLTVKPVNKVPGFTKGADQTSANVGASSIANWATAITAGAGETGQLTTFLVSNTDNALFSVQPALSPTGTLSFTPAAGVTGSATVSVRIQDNGGTANGGVDTSAVQTFTITTVPDTTGPSGGSVDAVGLGGTGARYSTSTTLSVALAKGTDPSGVAASGAQLLRASATLTGGTCGSYGTYALVTGGADPASPKSDSVGDQACYRYQYVVADTLGNATTYTSPDIKVDTTAPTTPALAFSAFTNAYWTGSGSTVYYRSAAAAGSFTVTGTATDAASGIASYAYPALGANWSSAPGALGVATYSWSGAPAAPGTVNATATNNAGGSSSGPFTLTADDTAPSTGTVGYADGSAGGTTISVSFTTGTDAASGVGARLLQRASAPFTGITCGTFGSFATITGGTNPTSPVVDTLTTGTCYKYQYVVSDNVGNTTTASSSNVAHTPFGAYWSFDGDTGTAATDSSGNGNTGALQATAARTTGKVGSGAVNLTGATTSWIDVPNTVIDSSQSYTVSAWVKPTSVAGFQTFASMDGTTISPFYLQISPSGPGSAAVFDFAQRGSDSTSAALAQVNGLTPTVGVWYNLVGVYDKSAGTIQLYVNGVSQGTAAAAGGWKATGHTTIGRAKWAGAGTDYANAAVDEVHYYDRALTAVEAAHLAGSYTSIVTGTTGLVNDWRLGESSAASPMTDAASANNGSYVNTPTVGVAGAVSGDANTAVRFDGVSQYATAPRQISGDFSIELWFKSTQSYSNDLGNPHCTYWWQGAGLIDADVSGPGNDFGLSLCSGKVIAGVGGSPDTGIVSPATYNDGAWHQVVFTRAQATGAMTLYVDGASVGSATGSVAALTSSATINVGRSTSGTNYFAGTLDEIALYNVVLPPATVAAHRNAAL